MLPYAVSYNFTLCLMLLQHIYNGQPYARVDFIPQSWTQDLASVWYLYGVSLKIRENMKYYYFYNLAVFPSLFSKPNIFNIFSLKNNFVSARKNKINSECQNNLLSAANSSIVVFVSNTLEIKWRWRTRRRCSKRFRCRGRWRW